MGRGVRGVALAAAAAMVAQLIWGCGADSADETGGGAGNAGGQGGTAAQGGGGAGGDDCPSGVYCGSLAECCELDEECVLDLQCLPICETVRCGDNQTECCQAGEICLEGVVCAADCEDDEALCGAALDVCCPAGDVCVYDACVTPGRDCDDNFDCLDESMYCEQTLGKCLPLPPGELCEGHPSFHDIEPELEWFWQGVDYLGNWYMNIIVAPAVGDVNGDGTPDVVVVTYRGTDNTLIVVLDGAGDGTGGGDVLFTIPSAADPTAPQPHWLGGVALANFDADDGLEIVYTTQTSSVRIADNDGQGDLGERTGMGGDMALTGGPSVADLNHDGTPDVIVKCYALDGTDITDPSLDLVNRDCEQGGTDGRSSVVADLDEDGTPEVVTARYAYTVNPGTGGDPFWTGDNGQLSGHLAIADILDSNPGPEVININAGLYLLDGATGGVLIGDGGSLISTHVDIPGGGHGGAPTVADFDGDGLPEISSAGLSHYVVYDPDCWAPPLRAGGACASGSTDLKLWETPTQDASSHRTGSSVFDFQGDGPAEVLYNDECFFHIYDGTTGAELVTPVVPSSSQTASEYPLVADVDGDGNAEMIVISSAATAIDRDDCDTAWKAASVDIDWLCQYTTCVDGGACAGGVGGTCDHLDGLSGGYFDSYQCDSAGRCQQAGGIGGVRIYGDSHDRWVMTRPVWNQFHYHVTNFEYQAGVWDVPTTEQPSWLSYNNFRQNVQGGVAFPVPDLTVQLTATTICPAEVKLTAVVSNEGSAGAPAGVQVHFYRTDAGADDPPELLGVMTTTTTILPGGWERLVMSFAPVPVGVDLEFSVSVDLLGAVEECDDGNNDAVSGVVRCEPVPE